MLKLRRMKETGHLIRERKFENACRFCIGNIEDTRRLSILGVYWRTILTFILKKYGFRKWTWFKLL
jgi:hypothetical protein